MRSVLTEIALDDSQLAGRTLRRMARHVPTRLVFGRRFTKARALLIESEAWDRERCQNWIRGRVADAVEDLADDRAAPEWPDWLSLPRRPTISRDELSA